MSQVFYGRKPFKVDDLPWNMNFDGKHLMQENFGWITTLDGTWPLMEKRPSMKHNLQWKIEDDLKWNKTFDKICPLLEENLQLKITFNGRKPSSKGSDKSQSYLSFFWNVPWAKLFKKTFVIVFLDPFYLLQILLLNDRECFTMIHSFDSMVNFGVIWIETYSAMCRWFPWAQLFWMKKTFGQTFLPKVILIYLCHLSFFGLIWIETYSAICRWFPWAQLFWMKKTFYQTFIAKVKVIHLKFQ